MRRLTATALAFAVVLTLWAIPGHPQETQTEPAPNLPAPKVQKDDPGAAPTQQKPAQQTAPIVRRSAKPTADPAEPAAGPLNRSGSGSPAQRPVNAEGDVGTLRVETRLVNIALNVVDEHGMPIGGFEKSDFRVFEDGQPQPISIFEREASSPLSIVLAIDSSETVVTSERLEREAAKHFVRAILRPQDELALMDFSDQVREIVPFTNQAKQIEQGLGQLQRGDETALYNAIYLASDRLSQTKGDAGRRRVLVIISDGGDTKKQTQYTQAIEQAQRAGAMIFSIIVVPVAADAGRNTGGEHALIQMSEDTGGKYYYVQDPADLEPAFRHVSDDLRTQYLLGYYAPRTIREGGFRRITVKLTDASVAEKYSLRYRTGYYADSIH